MTDKVMRLEELAPVLERLRGEGRRIVQCHGVFDLLHPGHIFHLQGAKGLGDVLVVTLTRDAYVNKGPGRPVFNERLRAQTLAALECVDYVAFSEEPSAVTAIRTVRPHIYVKGSDYQETEKDLTGNIQREREAVEAVGGRIHFTHEPTFSSTALLNAHFPPYPEGAHQFLREFRQRYSAEGVIGRLRSLQALRVMVVGEAIIDQYHYCTPMLGKSAKELLIPMRFVEEESFAGGALAVANHLAGFCGEVRLVTLLGVDGGHEEFIRSRLLPNVRPTFFYRPDAPTIVKRRYVERVFRGKMFEVCWLNDSDLPPDLQAQVGDLLAQEAPRYDMVLAADYGHGLLTKGLAQTLARSAPFLAVNTQTNSANLGFNLVTKYPRADYICIDEPELRLASGERWSPLEPLVSHLSSQTGAPRLAVTRGHLGSLAFGAEEGFFSIPVFSTQVVDRMGAGDAYFAISSLCARGGLPMELVGFVGNAVGALAVRIVGNREPVGPVPLFRFITALLKW